MSRPTTMAILMLCCCGVTAAGGKSFCEPLLDVVRSAEARDQLADVTGTDAGIYHETNARLPGSQYCFSDPDDWPDASWRCLVGSEGKYTLALRLQGKVESRVTDCLGPDWAAETTREGAYLMKTVFTKPDSPARVQVMTTKEVEPKHGWHAHRVIVAVFSPRRDGPATGN